MILITVGTHKLSFNRLLHMIDKLIDQGIVERDSIFAQTGYSTYTPKNYYFTPFIEPDEFDGLIEKSDLIITHGGTGSIVTALKKQKRVIAVARQAQYHEHVDDHQREIIHYFKENGHIIAVETIEQLGEVLCSSKHFLPKPYQSGNIKIKSIIREFIDNIN